MKYKRLNISAFTLWELLVAMIITGLIIDLGYVVYLKAEKKIGTDQQEKIKLFDIIMFEKSLREVVESSEYILREGPELLFIDDQNESILEYRDSLMILYDSMKDLSDSCKITYFMTTSMDSIPCFIGTIEYGVPVEFDTLHIVIHKVYSRQIMYDKLIQ